MNAKRILMMTLVLFAALCTVTAWAGEPLKVAVVDIQRCVTDSIKGKALNEEFMASAEGIKAELTKKETEIRAMATELEKQQMLLSETALQERRQDIISRQQSFKEEVEAQQEQIRAESDKLTELVLRDLQAILLDMVEEGGYDLVFSNRGPWLLHWNKTMDVTDDLIRRYDESVKKAE